MPNAERPANTTTSLQELIERGNRYGTIYADPPWRYDNSSTRGAAANHYPTMTVEEIANLPIEQLAAKSAHLHLWTTNGFLFEAKRVMEQWGFVYKSVLLWVKPTIGLGHYWRVAHEFLLLGVRGTGVAFRDRSLRSWVEAKRTAHSRKPEVVRRMIEAVSPGPYLELFARSATPGWSVWGNEVDNHLFAGDGNDRMPLDICQEPR